MRSVLTWLVFAVLMLALLLLGAGQLGLLQGKRPANLGAKGGRLMAPSGTPNSVSSQAMLHPGHAQQAYAAIEPLRLRAGDPAASMAALRKLVESMRGASVIAQQDGYLYVEFATPLLRFIDDVEFWADSTAGVIHVRSASRLGRKDFGVNRERIERIRAAWVGQAAQV